jgi:hypothetical protein
MKSFPLAVLLTGTITLATSACTARTRASTRGDQLPASAPTAGGTDLSATSCNPRDRNATLAGHAVLNFTPASSGEALVRVEGESSRSTVRIDVATGTTLELREGTYLLRISVQGYRNVEKSIKVVCGKELAVPIALSKR